MKPRRQRTGLFDGAMELSDIRSCLITGGAAGIGAGVAAAFAARGCGITLADRDARAGAETAQRLKAQFIRCDVTDARQLAAAFDTHYSKFGSPDALFLNAGVEERTSFLDEDDEHVAGWRHVLDVDFTAVAEGVRLAVRRWKRIGARGTIVVTSSAAGLFPVPGGEVYAAAKGACVQLVRSLAHLAPQIRVCALCPAYADTAMVARMRSKLPETQPLLSLPQVVDAAMRCFADPTNAGKCLWVAPGIQRYWRFPFDGTPMDGRRRNLTAAEQPRRHPAWVAWAAQSLPSSQSCVRIHKLSSDFAAATRVDTMALNLTPRPGHALVRRIYAGVNASDVNFSSGRYFGTTNAAAAKLPFVAGFETVGVVVAVAPDVAGQLSVGDVVGSLSYGGFAEYAHEPVKALLPGLPPSKEAVAMLTSGLTASIALEQAAQLKPSDVVLVTAAAGGTGQFAVQLASRAGCYVIATCGGPAKVDLLRRLGAARVIDYTAEDVKAVLKREHPTGVNVVYESVGGAMFDTCLAALAPKGRLVVIGAMSRYASGWAAPSAAPTTVQDVLLFKSATCVGFFLPLYAAHFRRHVAQLASMHASGQLTIAIDPELFVGLESATAAVAHLQSGKSLGKVVLQIPDALPAMTASSAKL